MPVGESAPVRLPQPVALTIAGSDSGGGAGIQADLATFAAFGCFGTSAITALTAQNTLGVHGVETVAPAFVQAQMRAVLVDMGAAVVKTGMLGSAEVVEAVAETLKEHMAQLAQSARPDRELPIVCDPVMVAKGGAKLLRPSAVRALVEKLFPLCWLVTPNGDEVEALIQMRPTTLAGLADAARRLAAFGPRGVLLKGGHLPIEEGVALDVLLWEGELFALRHPRLDAPPNHGGGCTLSSAIAAGIALGWAVPEACARARAYVQRGLEQGGVPGEGRGHGTLARQIPVPEMGPIEPLRI